MAKHAVVGTGFEGRAGSIRKYCKVGMLVTLMREKNNNHDDNAIAVYITVKTLFGLIKSKHQIGYIRAAAAKKIAKRIDAGEKYSVFIDAIHAQEWKDSPDVTLDLKFIK